MPTKSKANAPKEFKIPDGLGDLPLPLLIYLPDSKEIHANRAFERLFGPVPPSRFSGRPAIALVHERPVHESVFSLPGRHEGFVVESVEGLKIPVELRISPLNAGGRSASLVLFEDVTAKLELERQLIENHVALTQAFADLKHTQSALTQAAKLASLGELSSGIAHELNQPLQAILGFSQELQQFEPLSPSGKEFLSDIIHASKKMAEIIKSLRSFAREAGDEVVDTSLEHAIREAAKLVNHSLLQRGISLEIRSGSHAPLVSANPIQLEQVFVNLLSNAMDAIEEAHAGKGTITVSISESADGVRVSVADDGCGMSEEVRQRIFDPFFTTKETGKGTGLGLSITHGILEKIGARVEVLSTPGHGTRFELTFRPAGRIKKKGEAA